MNIEVQCCGVVLMMVVFYFYIRRKKLNLNTQKAFFRLFAITILSLSLDIISIIALTNHEMIAEWIIDMICRSYISSMILTAMAALMYVLIDVYNESVKYRKLSVICVAVAVVGIVLVFVSPIYKSWDNPEFIYTHGPSVMLTYFFCLLFLAAVIVLLIVRRKSMDPRRWESMRVWMFLWIGAALVQFFNNELLLVGFASAIGNIIIYLKLENPELLYDKNTGFFNQEALLLYTNQLHKRGKAFSVVQLKFPHFWGGRSAESRESILENELKEYLFEIEEATVFKNDDNELLFIFEEPLKAERAYPAMKNRFEFGWGNDGNVFLDPDWVYLADAMVMNKSEDILALMRFARSYGRINKPEAEIVIDEQIVSSMYEERKVEQLIEEAIENERVEVFYQPIYSTEEARFTSAEALMRIRTENDEILPPGVFIEIAERNGTIMKLGEIVFEKVCRFLRDHKPERYGLRYVEVNLSVVQCGYEHLADNFMHIMKHYQVSPSQLNLEITESASVGEKKILQENMAALMDFGVKFSLDDFGTGQSNLNYIVEMPVDIVKFDRSMINSYFQNGKAKYVMDAAMHMIHGMELQIVSEGIETREQFDTMRDLGISYIQGYYFSKPLPEADFMQFIKEHHK